MTSDVIVEQQDMVCVIKLNRPSKKNAITIEMYDAMADALAKADQDPKTRVVVMATNGEDFSTGNDLEDFMANPDLDENSGPARFIFKIASMRKPLIGAVEGLAVGVGATMLLHCDMVYAGKSASMIFPFVNMALVPEAGSSLLLPRMIGHVKAAEILMLGDPVSAQDAADLGMINRVTADGKALDRAMKTANRLCQKPPTALLRTKELLHSQELGLKGRMVQELDIFSNCLKSPELAEAIRAFLEKRPPDFSKF